ncbi:hypothetical protein [Pseudoalteromonas sp. MEBiC 03485]|uniref:hypothetical protein n=1 Tax=Alteromonadales TaxID=135622 RepID=UPI00102106AA|nr:hypothetical protein [Pseudoalteromonas sp. MEBiC 03485]QWV04262.1 hypothetical protein KQ246_12345 [Pseudoalteromonas shioyasakiensis]RZD21665.1 hypothetical protein EVU92_06190 [Pseudoalteromonas sp. MEBiC 03485]
MNKTLLISVVVIALILVADFNSRLSLKSTEKDSDFSQQSLVEVSLPLLSDSSKQGLEKVYKKYTQPEQSSKVQEKGLSAAKQAEQNGELVTVFADNYELRLKAVIFTIKPYVLIEQKDINDGSSQLVKYNDMQTVHGYSLKILSNTEVELSKDQQNITLTMYKRG